MKIYATNKAITSAGGKRRTTEARRARRRRKASAIDPDGSQRAAGSEAAVRFSIFELFGWTAFLAVLCALLSRAEWSAAAIALGWFVATILALKFRGRGTALLLSLAIACGIVLYIVFDAIPVKAGQPDYLDLVATVGFFGLTTLSWIIWGIVLLMDSLITYLAGCFNRRDQTHGTEP